MIVTRAPSEPFTLVQKTLKAMLLQEYPHDTWLADEDPTDEIMNWCKENGVQVCSRKGIPEYNRSTWPRRTKCKEGNLAWFYDTYGYENYDIVVQLDADHVPTKSYLYEMLKPFTRDSIGYVSAPSICDVNASTSWAARGRLHAEAIMHGPLQAGYTYYYAPLCIGSHYAVRTKALKQAGGLGPELAEDHSTTLLLNASSWKGIHAIDAIAHGDGPQTLKDMLVQEFQWSRSLAILLVTLLPQKWSSIPWKMKIQFLFSELWFSIFSITMLIGFLLPIVTILTNTPMVNVDFIDFVLHALPVTYSIFLAVYFLKIKQILRPSYSPFLSWEMALFQLVRWPWNLYGSFMGLVVGIMGKTPPFLVTVKGKKVKGILEPGILYTFAFLILCTFVPFFIENKNSAVDGYYFFLIMNLCIYCLVTALVLGLQIVESSKLNKIASE
jgi:cellulose synthase/poly-beta-1,6-N-acetylglucosamine synthase-like glycosyltransferase